MGRGTGLISITQHFTICLYQKMARVDITTRALDAELAEASVFHAVVVSCPQPKETRMHLTNLIDLIAEVAAKRVAKEGKQEEDTPDAVRMLWRMIRAARWNGCHNFTRFLGFGRALDRAA